MTNYDRSQLHLETDGGFVLGKSVLGVDELIAEVDAWTDVLDDFLSIDLNRSVATEMGVFFRPEVATMTLRTTNREFLEGARGRRMRLRYGNEVLFVGEVINASYTPDKYQEKTVINLNAVDTTSKANNWQQVNFTAPQETVEQRVLRLMPEARVYGCNRTMRARDESTVQLSTLMQEAADTQIARFYVNSRNEVIVDGDPAPEPFLMFKDTPDPRVELTNLVTNPSFEDGLISWTSDEGTHEVVTEGARKFVRVSTVGEDGYASLSQTIDVTGMTKATLMGSMRTPSGLAYEYGTWIAINWLDVNDDVLDLSVIEREGTEGSWLTVSETFDVPAEAVSAQVFMDSDAGGEGTDFDKLLLVGAVYAGTWFAETQTVPVTETLEPTVFNYVTNPSLESGIEGWSLGEWTVEHSTVPGEFRYGNGGLKATAAITEYAAEGRTMMFDPTPNIALEPGTYTASVWLKSTASMYAFVPNFAKLVLHFVGRTSVETPIELVPNVWTRVTIDNITVGSGVSLASMNVQLAYPYGTHHAYIDGVSLVRGDTTLPYFDGDSPGASWSGDPHNSISVLNPPQQVDYSSLSMEENIAYTVTGAVVEVAGENDDPVLKAYRAHPNAVIVNENKYSPAVPYNQTDVNAWAASFPVKGAPEWSPKTIRAPWQEALIDLELCSRIMVLNDGRSYDTGVVGINHNITPEKWLVNIDCIPGHVLTGTSITAPSTPRNFKGVSTIDTVNLSWTRPLSSESLTGYEIRFKEGTVAPAHRQDGELLTETTALAFAHTGRDSDTTYSYAIWALTASDNVYSGRVTTSATTLEHVPSAPQNLVVTRGGNAATATISWDAPATGDASDYVVNIRPTGGSTSVVVTANESYTFTTLLRNTDYTINVRGRTGKGTSGPNATTSHSTDEVVPGVPGSFTATASAWNNIALSWTHGTNTGGDRSSYMVVGRRGSTPPATQTEPGSYVIGYPTGTSLNHTVEGGQQWSYRIWPKTPGGLSGASATASATTPVGVISRYYEGAATWTRTYKGDGTKRTDGNGTLMYQGYSAAFNGNMGSLAGFALPGNIVGAYAVDKVEIVWPQQHTYYNNGATWYVGYHSNAAEPNTFVNAAERVASYNVPKTGGVTVNATSWLATHLRNGAKGIVFGRAPSTSDAFYGYAGTPTIRVHYRTIG